MLGLWHDFLEWWHHRRFGVVPSVLRAYALALLFGFIFLSLTLHPQLKGEPQDPLREAITFVVAFVGIQLLAVYDVSKKHNAKRKLGLFLAELSPEDLERLRIIVSSTTFPALFGSFPPERFDERLSGWRGILFFLSNEPLGSTASHALFQPSLAGRLRYLDSALWQARRRRFV